MHKNICKNPHRYDASFDYLADYQGQTGRHKCSGCAFELGHHHALVGAPKAKNDSVLECIPDSQAGSVRHKDAFEAYNHGYNSVIDMALRKAA